MVRLSFGLLEPGGLKRQLAAGEHTIGTFLGLASTLAAEVCAASGVDWVLVDLEHGSADEAMIGPIALAAAAYGVPTVVRVEVPERIRIGRALDQGVDGIMLPRVESVDEVERYLSYMNFPPHGVRGVATYNRAARWGLNPAAVMGSESEAACIVQIETLSALDSVEEIAAVQGVDLVFVGPLDLSFALGVPRQFDHPTYLDALDRVVRAAEKAGKPAGILAADKSAGVKLAERGFRFIGVGSDSTVLSAGLRDAVDTLRDKRN